MSFHPLMAYAPGRLAQVGTRLADEASRSPSPPSARPRSKRAVGRYPPDQRKSAILYALYLAQQQQGYLTARDAARGADRLHAAEVEDVVSYYTMFYTGRSEVRAERVPHALVRAGRRRACDGGAEREAGDPPGETDPSGTFTLIEVECLGACDRAPVVMVNDDWHERRDAREW